MSPIVAGDTLWLVLLMFQTLSEGVPRRFANKRNIVLPRFREEDLANGREQTQTILDS